MGHPATGPDPPGVPIASAASAAGAVAIVIPIYRREPSRLEAMALAQCCQLLGGHPIVFVCGETLDVTPYVLRCRRYAIEPLVERFEARSFASIDSYNTLLLDRRFYARFTNYPFILIQQLDAFVFKDTLEDWCKQGYDYIGAPWFEGYDDATADAPMLPCGGNGGLSLRRVSAFMTVLSPPFPRSRVKTWDDLWRKYQGMSLFGKAFRYHRLLSRYRRPSNWYGNFLPHPNMFEDEFFSNVVPRIFPGFKVAPSAVGMWFAFESQPRRLYELTSHELPFGCHAWERYDMEFWQPIMESFGHAIGSVEVAAGPSAETDICGSC